MQDSLKIGDSREFDAGLKDMLRCQHGGHSLEPLLSRRRDIAI
jgi:hypothetical protein